MRREIANPVLILFLAFPAATPVTAGAEETVVDFPRRLGDLLERVWFSRPEWGDMAVSLLKGEGLDGEKGWWRPGGRRRGWEWLRGRFDANSDGVVEAGELPEAERYLERLDVDGDGAVTGADFQPLRWGPDAEMAQFLFRRLDPDSNGRISREDLGAFFDRADRDGLGYLSVEDVARALRDPPGPQREGGGGGGGGMPSPWAMLAMLGSGQLGSLREGPAVGDPAPDFRLETGEGKACRLSDSRGKRPVVLIFGSFT